MKNHLPESSIHFPRDFGSEEDKCRITWRLNDAFPWRHTVRETSDVIDMPSTVGVLPSDPEPMPRGYAQRRASSRPDSWPVPDVETTQCGLHTSKW